MNILNLDIEQLEGPTPLVPVVRAAEWNILQCAQQLIDEARQQSADLLARAQVQAEQMRTASAQLGAEERLACMQETRDAVVAQSLNWLVEEARLEALLVDNVAARIRESMAVVLRNWLGEKNEQNEQNRIAQLAQQLTMLVCEQAKQRPYRIRLCPAECESMQQQLKLDGIECIADATLKAGQAVIDTEFLCIAFDLDRHQEQVLAALR